MTTKFLAAAIAAMGLAMALPASAQQGVKIGILNDQSGVYADYGGKWSVEAANMAVEEFGGTVLGQKIEVISEKDFFIHVSGHPAREELKRMYAMVRPAIAVPTHGEARHLHEHALLAKSLGVKETVEAFNGAIVWLAKGEASVIGKVHSGYIAIDGTSMISTDGDILRTRRKLRDDGAIFVSLVIGKDGDLVHPVQLAAPGILDIKEDDELIAECIDEVTKTMSKIKPRAGDKQIIEDVRMAMRKLLKRELDKKPVIEVHVARV